MRTLVFLVMFAAGCATHTDFSGLSNQEKIELYYAMSQSMRVQPVPLQYYPMPIQPYPQPVEVNVYEH